MRRQQGMRSSVCQVSSCPLHVPASARSDVSVSTHAGHYMNAHRPAMCHWSVILYRYSDGVQEVNYLV